MRLPPAATNADRENERTRSGPASTMISVKFGSTATSLRRAVDREACRDVRELQVDREGAAIHGPVSRARRGDHLTVDHAAAVDREFDIVHGTASFIGLLYVRLASIGHRASVETLKAVAGFCARQPSIACRGPARSAPACPERGAGEAGEEIDGEAEAGDEHARFHVADLEADQQPAIGRDHGEHDRQAADDKRAGR